jgi:hypothetical protein
MLRVLITALVMTPTVLGQPGPDPLVLVLTRLPGAPAAGLLIANTVTGALTPLGPFAADGLSPLAVTWDPINGDVIVALDDMPGTRIVRLGYSNGIVIAERTLAVLPFTVTDIGIAELGDVFVGVAGPGGSIYRIPRNGGLPVIAASLVPGPSVMEIVWGTTALVVQEVPGADARLHFVDLSTGTTPQTATMPSTAGIQFTGIVDLPTGAIRQALTDTQGNLHLFEFLSTTTPWPVTPPFVPGATAALALGGQGVLVLGGAQDPTIRTVPIFSNTSSFLAGPLPGDPVDFEPLPAPFPHAIRFGQPCALAGAWTSSGSPFLGNTSFQFGLQGGLPNVATVLVIGVSDQTWLQSSLPLTAPGGCQLLVSGDLLLWTVSDAAGGTNMTIPIPGDPAFSGVIVFAQWVQDNASLPLLSDAAAVHLGQ